MTTPSSEHDAARDQLLGSALEEYYRRIDAGEDVLREEFIAVHSEVAAELRLHFESLDLVSSLDGDHVTPVVPGETIRYFGEFELLSEISRGGMGVVYRARQVRLGRIVALKMMINQALASPIEVARFFTEARAAARLEHPSIVRVYEVNEHDGRHYIAMQLIEGDSLAARLRDGPLDPETAAEYLRDTARAVHFAHGHGVLHRDLKPSNILIDANGRALVADFGLARLADEDAALTRTGIRFGTPNFMPPEQAAGEWNLVDARSDVYSLGASLYALLTARPPFQAATADETAWQVRNEPVVPPRQLNRAVPRDLDTICVKCLEKAADRRYHTANDLADDLERWLKHEPVRAKPIRPWIRAIRWSKRNRGWSFAVVAALMAVVASFMTLWLLLRQAGLEEGRIAKSLVQQIRLTPHASTGDRSWSDEAADLITRIATIRTDEALRDEAVALLSGLDAKPRYHTASIGASHLAFDSKGDQLLLGGVHDTATNEPIPAHLWTIGEAVPRQIQVVAAGPVWFDKDGTPVQFVYENGAKATRFVAMNLQDNSHVMELVPPKTTHITPWNLWDDVNLVATTRDGKFVATCVVDDAGEYSVVAWNTQDKSVVLLSKA